MPFPALDAPLTDHASVTYTVYVPGHSVWDSLLRHLVRGLGGYKESTLRLCWNFTSASPSLLSKLRSVDACTGAGVLNIDSYYRGAGKGTVRRARQLVGNGEEGGELVNAHLKRKRSRKTVKAQRGIVGADLQSILARRQQTVRAQLASL